MLWMETYLLYCSVRLGVMVISVLAFLSTFIPSILFFIMGLDVLNPIRQLFYDDANFRKQFIVKKYTDMVDNDASKLLILFQTYLFMHMAASVMAFYGALKIRKYFLIPLSIFDLFRLIYCLSAHILLMTACKNQFNLGVLITATLAGGFLILYLGYNWATIVALYQVITLINSERYKTIYGDDPFKPLIPRTYNPLITENVRVLITPKSDIDDQKKRNQTNGIIGTSQFNGQRPQQVISVIPASDDHHKPKERKWKWRNGQLPIMDGNRGQRAVTNQNDTQNLYNGPTNYNYWQWSELAPVAISERNKRNIYMANNWKY